MYLGLSAVLNIAVDRNVLKLSAHRTYRSASPVVMPWNVRVPVDAVVGMVPSMLAYLRWVSTAIEDRWVAKEGRVHACIAASLDPTYVAVNREVSVGFASTVDRDGWAPLIADELLDACRRGRDDASWWSKVIDGPGLGTGLDYLGIDDRGRLLAIEAKDAGSAEGIARGPVQTTFYGRLIAAWAQAEPAASTIVNGMLAQRSAIGLVDQRHEAQDPVRVVPVLAIGAGRRSSTSIERAAAVAHALAAVSSGLDPLEIWTLDAAGAIDGRTVIGP